MLGRDGFWKKTAPRYSRAQRGKDLFSPEKHRAVIARMGPAEGKNAIAARNGSAFAQHVGVEGVHLLLGGEDRHVHLIAHRAGKRVGDALHHAQLRTIASEQLVVAERERLSVTPAGKGAEVVLARRQGGMVESDHVRPDLVNVGAVGIVHHVGREAAAGTHVDLEGHHVALLAHAGLILRQAEELEVDEPALDAKALDRGTARSAHVVGQITHDVVDGVVVVVDDVHDGKGRHIAGFKHGLAMGIDDGVIAVDLGVDELLHDVAHIRLALGVQKPAKAALVRQLVGVRRAHAVVRLDHHGIPHRFDKGAAAVEIVHDVVARHGDARLFVVFLHAGLVLDAFHILRLEAAFNVKIRAEPGIALQPVFIVALQPVDAAIAEDEKRDRPVHLVVVFQTGHLVVFVQAVLELGRKLVVGLIADAQHVEPVVFELPAELPVVGWKIGRKKDKIFHFKPGSFRASRRHSIWSVQQEGHEVRYLFVPPVPIVRAVIPPHVHPYLNPLLGEDVPKAQGGLGNFPWALTHAQDAAVVIVALDVGVIGGHPGQIIDGRIAVDFLVHVAVKAVGSGVDAAEGQQPVKEVREAEKQVGRVQRAQAAPEGDDAGISLPAVEPVGLAADEGDGLAGDEVHPLLMAADAPVGIAALVGPGFAVNGVDGKDHHATGVDPGGPGVGHVEIFKVIEAAVLTGDEQHRPPRVAVALDLHVAPQRRAVLPVILRLH